MSKALSIITDFYSLQQLALELQNLPILSTDFEIKLVQFKQKTNELEPVLVNYFGSDAELLKLLCELKDTVCELCAHQS